LERGPWAKACDPAPVSVNVSEVRSSDPAEVKVRGRKVSEMAKATWNGKVIAESDAIETVEGNVYFPESAINREYFRPSSTISTCPWKGQARYYSLLIDGQENPDAAWYYPDPKPAARNIKNHVAFWRGVEVEK
jgi:uncharacterized protein (DUF427 family)